MATKTISLMEDVYKGLLRAKRKGESFSDEIRRLLKTRKRKLSSAAGLWNWMSKEHIESIEHAIEERRKYSAKVRKERLP